MFLLFLPGDDSRSGGHLQGARHSGTVEGLQCRCTQGQRGVSRATLHFLLLQGARDRPAGENVSLLPGFDVNMKVIYIQGGDEREQAGWGGCCLQVFHMTALFKNNHDCCGGLA